MDMSDNKEQLKNINLWIETIEKLKSHNLTWDDVKKVIVTERFVIDKNEFERVASRLNYNAGYGSLVIDPGLKIIGEDWWLERSEYDGKEWWEFKKMPNMELPKGSMEDLAIPYSGENKMMNESLVRWD